VLPGALWHRLRVQNLLEQLAELDQSFEHGRQLMAAFLREQTLREVAAEVDAFAPDLATLGWTLDDLLGWARLPVMSRRELKQELSRRLHPIVEATAVRRRAEL
jgi:hypothetical protein